MGDFKYENTFLPEYKDLSDIDFVRNIDQLVSKDPDPSKIVRTKMKPRSVTYCGNYVRRTFLLVIILIASLVEIFYALLSYFELGFIKQYVPLSDGILFFDFPKGMVGMSRVISDLFTKSPANAIVAYLASICLVLGPLFALFIFVFDLVALCSKRRKDGTFRRIDCSVFSVFGLISVALALLSMIIVGYAPQYGFLVMAVPFVVTFLCSFGCYKEVSFDVPEMFIRMDGSIDDSFTGLPY